MLLAQYGEIMTAFVRVLDLDDDVRLEWLGTAKQIWPVSIYTVKVLADN